MARKTVRLSDEHGGYGDFVPKHSVCTCSPRGLAVAARMSEEIILGTGESFLGSDMNIVQLRS